MSIADKLTVLAASKEMVRLKLGISEDVPFSEYSNHIGWDGITSDLGQSTTTAASQKLVTDREALLQTSIAAILGINKHLTNRINALEGYRISGLFNYGDNEGVWLDPSDLSTMYQDSKGITPVTKDGDPVGLMLDKSQGLESGGMHFKTDKGGFSGSEWVLDPENIDSSGRLVMAPASRKVVYNTTKPMLKGKTYKVEVEIDESINVSHGIRLIYTGSSFSSTYYFTDYFKAKGVHTYYISMPSLEVGYLGLIRVSSHTGEVYINSVSVTEVKGNHAIQETASARPIYRTDGDLHWLEFDGIDDKLQTIHFLDTQAGDKVYYNLKIDMLRKPSSGIWSIITVNSEMENMRTGVMGYDEDIRILDRNNGLSLTQLGKFNEVKHIEGYAYNVYVNNKHIEDYTRTGNSSLVSGNTAGILIGSRANTGSHNNMKLYFLCMIKSQSETEVPNKIIKSVSNKGLPL